MNMNAQTPVGFRDPRALAGLPIDTPLCVALSGGADSVALLAMLADAKPVSAVHVHHGIRGPEADRDEQFCRDLAALYPCRFHALRVDVPAIAQASGESLEMAARRVRYDFFWHLMREHGIPLLATAHHANDNLETVLLRLCAGSSTTGLGGISPLSEPIPGLCVVRPLLHETREEILAYCRKMQLAYVTDNTNADLTYPRNRIRAQVIPSLEKVSAHPQAQVLRTCRYLREDDDYLTELASAALQSATAPSGGLILNVLRELPLPILRRLLILALRAKSPSDGRLRSCHLDALLHLIDSGRGMSDLPGCLRAHADGNTLRFLPKDCTPQLISKNELMLPLAVGTFSDPHAHLTLHIEHVSVPCEPEESFFFANPQNVYNPFIHTTLTFDTILDDAHFRYRKEGDTLLLRGMHRRVRKLQNACGMPQELRERLPILCDRDGIVWVPFVGVRDGVAQTEHLSSDVWQITLHIHSAHPDQSSSKQCNPNSEV